MGTEFYLVKPEKKEVFYLGKHFCGFNKIPEMTYRASLEDARYPDYEDWDDFLWDTLRENWEYFTGCELTLEQVSDVIYKIYDWCISDKVILDNDCTPTASVWKDWKETGDITKILEEIHKEPELSYDKEALQERMEEEESILFRNPSYESAIIGITTDGRAVYDYYRMIEELSKEDDIDYGEAEDFILYNTVGSLRPAEEKFPIIMYKREDIA